MKRNLLLLKYLSEPWRTRFTNICISIQKCVADIVTEYNNTYHSTIKRNPVDVKSNSCIDFGVENNKGDPKFEVGDHVRILKYKNIFAKGYTPG